MDRFLATETLIIELLLVVSLVAIVVRRLRVPYTVALVLAGLFITFGEETSMSLTPELILALFVPPLVFEAAFHIEYKLLRDNFLPILVLAVVGVLLTTGIVALIVSAGVGVSLTTGLVFGALIAATDPVAVVALFRQLGAPKSLTVLVEGESLFNDGTAIVVFQLMLAAALPFALTTATGEVTSGNAAGGSFDLIGGVVSFVRVAAGGIGIGVALGWLASQIIARLDDYLIETTITTVLAFGAYLLAERFHVSGVLATVVAGIICGNTGLRGMSPTTRIVLFNFLGVSRVHRQFVCLPAHWSGREHTPTRGGDFPDQHRRSRRRRQSRACDLRIDVADESLLKFLRQSVGNLPTRHVLGRLTRSDFPCARLEYSRNIRRPRTLACDDVRRRAVHFARAGNDHASAVAAFRLDET